MSRKYPHGPDFDDRLALALETHLAGRQDTAEYVDLSRRLSRLSPPGPDALAIERVFTRFKASTAPPDAPWFRPRRISHRISRLTIGERFAAAGIAVSIIGLGAQASGIDVFAGVRRGGEVLAGFAGAIVPENPAGPDDGTVAASSTTPGDTPSPPVTSTAQPVATPGLTSTAQPASGSASAISGVPPTLAFSSATVTPQPTVFSQGPTVTPPTQNPQSPPAVATATPTLGPTQSLAPSATPSPTAERTPTIPLPTTTVPTASVVVTPTVLPTSTPVPTVTPTTPPAPVVEVFQAGIAGQVTLRVVDGRLEVIDITLAPGWIVTEPQVTSSFVHFKFVNGKAEVEFEASLEGGHIQHQVSSNGQVP